MIDLSCKTNGPLRLNVLSEEQIRELYRASVEILCKTGCKIQSNEVRKMFKTAGAIVDEEVVKIPEFIIEECICKTPKGFILYNREGGRAMEIEMWKAFFGSSCASPKVRDALTEEIRSTSIEDIKTHALIGDALENIDYQMPMGAAQDVPVDASDLYEFEALVTNTIKPIVFFGLSPRNYELVYEMAAAVAGSLDRMKERPFLIGYPENITPLVYPESTCSKLLFGASIGMPQVCIPAGQAGATSPITLAGTLALLLAESLVGLMIVQLKKAGTPYILGGFTSIMDMRTANVAWGAPEFSLMTAAFGDITRYFGLPSWGTAGTTDSKEMDLQAGIESTFSLMVQTLGGANIIHDVGDMDQGMISSAAMMVMGDEIIGMVKRLIRGIEVNTESIAREVIHSVGPGGNFLQETHTTRYCRSEHWIPELMVRESYETWKSSGAKTMRDKIQEKIKHLIETHKVSSLPDPVLEEFSKIKEKAQRDK